MSSMTKGLLCYTSYDGFKQLPPSMWIFLKPNTDVYVRFDNTRNLYRVKFIEAYEFCGVLKATIKLNNSTAGWEHLFVKEEVYNSIIKQINPLDNP